MPSKKIHVREYNVKAHDRIIHTRIYNFICQYCREISERETYATGCPKYGEKCNGVASKCLRCQKQ
ncbi:MAG: hypothetical protein AAFY76_14305 [Cyanobacteria bacterium J06649_11]